MLQSWRRVAIIFLVLQLIFGSIIPFFDDKNTVFFSPCCVTQTRLKQNFTSVWQHPNNELLHLCGMKSFIQRQIEPSAEGHVTCMVNSVVKRGTQIPFPMMVNSVNFTGIRKNANPYFSALPEIARISEMVSHRDSHSISMVKPPDRETKEPKSVLLSITGNRSNQWNGQPQGFTLN